MSLSVYKSLANLCLLRHEMPTAYRLINSDCLFVGGLEGIHIPGIVYTEEHIA